ncbi:MAG TPA: dTMP kinase [Anaerolineales bacterium]
MFITFEGSEGCGKTTQVAELAKYLCQQGHPVLVTREPGGTPIGDQIREVLFSMRNTDMEPRAEILLFQASRAQLVSKVILPHLQKGGIVLSDRYADSTLAYQGYGYQLDLIPLRALIDFATGGLKPDLTLLLDLDVAAGLKRRNKAGDINRLDAYQLEFYQRVRSGYHQMVQEDPQRWVVVDADQPLDQVQMAVRRVVLDRLKARREM